MPHGNNKGRDMVCPFWKDEGENFISCEGMVNRSKTIVCFATQESKASYAARKCKDMKGYKTCLYARALIEKYEGNDK